MRKRLLSATTIIALIGLVVVVIASSFSEFELEEKSVSATFDTDTGTDTDTDTDTGTEDSGTPPEPGMVFYKTLSVELLCASETVTWIRTWNISNQLIAVSYSNGRIEKGPAWGDIVKYSTSGTTTLPAFSTEYRKCRLAWGWGCDPCSATDACGVGCN